MAAIKNKSASTSTKLHVIHHLEYKKSNKTKLKVNNKKNSKKNNKFIWNLKLVIVSFYDEFIYFKNINKIINKYHNHGLIVIFDRYIYDRHIDLKINKRNKISIFFTKLSCILLKKPTLTFILNDDSQKIYSRNKEYKISEIREYKKSIINLCDALSIKYELVDLNNRDTTELSDYIINKINAKLYNF